MVFGTFDMIHEGHEDMFKQARALALDPHLIVSIARDSAAKRHRGFSPRNDEQARLRAVGEHSLVDQVMLGDEEGFENHIVVAAPDIIALGYDQEGEYVDGLEARLATVNLFPKIVRLRSFHPETFKTSKLRT